MKHPLSPAVEQYLLQHKEELLEMILSLTQIPAPSYQEDLRDDFCLDFYHKNGLSDAYVDEAKNVICPIACDGKKDLIVFIAHLDLVFPDREPLPVEVREGKVYSPGITDNTANAAAVMMLAKMVQELHLQSEEGLLFVNNSCEEGLGNLKGSRALMERYGDRIKAFYALDGHYDSINNDAVGSKRYELEFRTEGGHSYMAFGNQSAIHTMANFISTLCQIPVPKEKKTTYNIGMIHGGTSVNTIAEEAGMLYEFRSCHRGCLAFMDRAFWAAVEAYRAMNVQIEVKLLGERPCSGNVNVEEITRFTCEVLAQFGITPKICPGSTDCNIPLSMGIPAVCTAVCLGHGMHTREEWMDISSLDIGMKIAACLVSRYAK